MGLCPVELLRNLIPLVGRGHKRPKVLELWRCLGTGTCEQGFAPSTGTLAACPDQAPSLKSGWNTNSAWFPGWSSWANVKGIGQSWVPFPVVPGPGKSVCLRASEGTVVFVLHRHLLGWPGLSLGCQSWTSWYLTGRCSSLLLPTNRGRQGLSALYSQAGEQCPCRAEA